VIEFQRNPPVASSRSSIGSPNPLHMNNTPAYNQPFHPQHQQQQRQQLQQQQQHQQQQQQNLPYNQVFQPQQSQVNPTNSYVHPSLDRNHGQNNNVNRQQSAHAAEYQSHTQTPAIPSSFPELDELS